LDLDFLHHAENRVPDLRPPGARQNDQQGQWDGPGRSGH
jgi:hypothetical protein